MILSEKGNATPAEFEKYDAMNWSVALEDSGAGDWRDHWVLDGERADIRNTPQGMVFAAGPTAQDHACHAVLWTKQSFKGPMKVEFDFTRLDTVNRYVNILYFHAKGWGEGVPDDIHTWADQREVPYMRTYFSKMDLLHLSFAAFGDENDDDDNYLRVRRYPIHEGRSFRQTEVGPTIEESGFFKPGVLHRMCFFKTDSELALRLHCGEEALCHIWDITKVEPTCEGPLGIRHMFSKCSRYKDLRIYTLP